MRVGYDASVIRHAPHAGTARYARELLRAMAAQPPPGAELIVLSGWSRWRPEARWLRAVRRGVNLLADVGWLTGGAMAAAAAERLDAWLGPANTLPWLLPRPSVVTIHDVNFLAVPGSYDAAFARYAAISYRLAVARARRVITDSEASRRALIERIGADPQRVRAIYPGLDHATRIEPALAGPDVPRPYALFVGQTEPHKNVRLLIEAWGLAVPANLQLVIAGPPGRDDERLRRLAASSQAGRRIHFTGLLDERQLARLYADATLFVLPSLSEGFGFPPLEAMARGVPTAVSTAASLPEVTRDGAMHFDPHDADGLARLVARMSEDRDLRERLAADGRRVAQSYTWAATAVQVWEELRHAIDD